MDDYRATAAQQVAELEQRHRALEGELNGKGEYLFVLCRRAKERDAASPVCSCWVSRCDAAVQFTTRYGAHSLDCPVYRPSGDPVDRLDDEAQRKANEAGYQEPAQTR